MIAFAAAALVCLMIVATAGAQSSAFTGNWQLIAITYDPPVAQTELPAISLEISVASATVVMTRTRGDRQTTYEYQTDGVARSAEHLPPGAGGIFQRTTQASWDGDRLKLHQVVDRRGKNRNMNAQIDEEWQVGLDGSLLLVTRQRTTPRGVTTRKLTFARQ